MFSVLPRLPWRQAQRLSGNGSSVSALRRCSGTTNGSDDADKKGLTTTIPDEEEDDEFAMEGFQVEEEKEEDIESALAKLSKQEEDESTPQLASDLVARMVEATTRKLDNRVSIQAVLPAITSHTVSVLRASRISINTIQATGSSILGYPIENKVTAEVNISQLNLSTPARTALEILAGPRLKGDYVKIACNQYPTREENRVYIVSQIDRLVSAAKESVGDPVEQTPLETWHNVVEEVQKQASGEITEAGGVSLLLGETKG